MALEAPRRLRAWRRRYAVLHPDGRFNFYRREPSGSDAGDLRANFALSSEWECARAPEAHKLLFSFVIVGPESMVSLGAERAETTARWLRALEKQCERGAGAGSSIASPLLAATAPPPAASELLEPGAAADLASRPALAARVLACLADDVHAPTDRWRLRTLPRGCPPAVRLWGPRDAAAVAAPAAAALAAAAAAAAAVAAAVAGVRGAAPGVPARGGGGGGREARVQPRARACARRCCSRRRRGRRGAPRRRASDGATRRTTAASSAGGWWRR